MGEAFVPFSIMIRLCACLKKGLVISKRSFLLASICWVPDVEIDESMEDVGVGSRNDRHGRCVPEDYRL